MPPLSEIRPNAATCRVDAVEDGHASRIGDTTVTLPRG